MLKYWLVLASAIFWLKSAMSARSGRRRATRRPSFNATPRLAAK
jgi:hypothetical protein